MSDLLCLMMLGVCLKCLSFIGHLSVLLATLGVGTSSQKHLTCPYRHRHDEASPAPMAPQGLIASRVVYRRRGGGGKVPFPPPPLLLPTTSPARHPQEEGKHHLYSFFKALLSLLSSLSDFISSIA